MAGNGVNGFSGDGGPANAANIEYPGGLDVDQGGGTRGSRSGLIVDVMESLVEGHR